MQNTKNIHTHDTRTTQHHARTLTATEVWTLRSRCRPGRTPRRLLAPGLLQLDLRQLLTSGRKRWWPVISDVQLEPVAARSPPQSARANAGRAYCVGSIPACLFAAARSISSIFSSVIDLIGIIFGLHSTSLRLPFSEYTRPALGSTSCRMPLGLGSLIALVESSWGGREPAGRSSLQWPRNGCELKFGCGL